MVSVCQPTELGGSYYLSHSMNNFENPFGSRTVGESEHPVAEEVVQHNLDLNKQVEAGLRLRRLSTLRVYLFSPLGYLRFAATREGD